MLTIASHPKGSTVFTVPDPANPSLRIDAGPCPFEVIVLFDPPVLAPSAAAEADKLPTVNSGQPRFSPCSHSSQFTVKASKPESVPFAASFYSAAVDLNFDAQPVDMCNLPAVSNEPRCSLLSDCSTVAPDSHALLIFRATVCGKTARVLIDPGATHSFIATDFAERHQLQLAPSGHRAVVTADGKRVACKGELSTVHLKHRLYTTHLHNCMVFDLQDFDLILGMPWLKSANPDNNWQTHDVSITKQGHIHHIIALEHSAAPPLSRLQLVQMEDIVDLVHSQGCTAFVALLQDEHSKPVLPQACPPPADSAALLQDTLDEFQDVFSDDYGLPPRRDVECSIDEVPGSKPACLPIRRLSQLEIREARKQVLELLERGLIRPSASPYGAPILFVRKADGSLRMCVDYRVLNSRTVKDKFPLPRIDDLLDNLHNAHIFSTLDLKQGFYQMRVNPEHAHKTAFRVPFGHFEFVVTPFGLANAPSQFMRLMSSVLTPCISQGFCIVYLDDILVFSPTVEDHIQHLRAVFQCLRDNRLYLRLEKCHFFQSSVQYVGFTVQAGSLAPSPDKVKAVSDWPVPANPTDVRSFLGLAQYYRRFIRDFAKLALPLHRLTGKLAPFEWSQEAQTAFDALKEALCTAPVMRLPDPELVYHLNTDASDFALGAVLQQNFGDGLQPVGFESRKLQPAEINYPVHEKELLAGVWVITQKWRCYLEGVHFHWYTDAVSLQWLRSKPDLNRRQARWLMELAGYDFTVHHIPGKTNVVADALSRRIDLHCNVISAAKAAQHTGAVSLLADYFKACTSDTYLAKKLKDPKAGFKVDKRFVWRNGLLYIPNSPELRQHLISLAHFGLCHLGAAKTAEALLRSYYWKGLRADVEKFCAACDSCIRYKNRNTAPFGKLHTMPIPSYRFQSMATDAITGLPVINGFSAVLSFICRFTKYLILVPVKGDFSAATWCKAFMDYVVHVHGVPESIVSDRDSRLTGKFFSTVAELLAVKHKLSTTAHPESDGVTEIAQKTWVTMLRAHIDGNPKQWLQHLYAVQSSYNAAVHSSTGYSPNYLVFGRHVRSPLEAMHSIAVGETQVEHAAEFISDLQTACANAHEALQRAAGRMKAQADKHRREAPVFKQGDKVYLSTKNLRLPGCRKLHPRFVGPFEVLAAQPGDVYRLKLPQHWKVHDRFHVGLLKPAPEVVFAPFSTHSSPTFVPSPDITVSQMGAIRAERKTARGGQEYLVEWVGMSFEDAEWVSADKVDEALIDTWREFHPRRFHGESGYDDHLDTFSDED